MKLGEARRDRLITQRELATRAGVSAGTITRIERGNVAPSLETIRKICDVLGMQPREIDEFRDVITGTGTELAPITA